MMFFKVKNVFLNVVAITAIEEVTDQADNKPCGLLIHVGGTVIQIDGVTAGKFLADLENFMKMWNLTRVKP